MDGPRRASGRMARVVGEVGPAPPCGDGSGGAEAPPRDGSGQGLVSRDLGPARPRQGGRQATVRTDFTTIVWAYLS